MKKINLALLLLSLFLLQSCLSNTPDIEQRITPLSPTESGDLSPTESSPIPTIEDTQPPPTVVPSPQATDTSIPPTVEPSPQATNTSVPPSVEPAPEATDTSISLTVEPSPQATDTSVPPTVEPSPQATNTIVPPTVEPSPQAVDPDAPHQPSLFNIAWDNKEIFAANLIDQEEGILDELGGASIYHLMVEIADLTTVNGRMEVRYSNQESTPLDEIYFHLFPGQLGGFITTENVTVNKQPVEAINESTVLRVPLPSAIQPGEEVTVGIDFTTTVPVEDTIKYNILAYGEDILALAHFYPMVAVYDDEGWQIEPSPPHGDETYADMSYYLVQVTAPQEQVIAASGTDVNKAETNGVQIKTIVAGPVRDFYMVMSDRFSVVSNTVGSIEINSYAPQRLMDGAQFALDVTSQAVQSFTNRFGPYPYSELDVVSTPTLALGVEYPGIFVNAVRIYDLEETTSGTSNVAYLESTTAHETAHQWFYNLVGNDQLNEPWLDEAITQYATWTYFIDRYGEQAAQGFYDSLEGRWSRTGFADIPIGLPAEDYSGAEYGAIVYGRGPIFLNELAMTIGQETFDQFLRDYVQTYRWQIATTEEFQSLAETHCNCDLTDLFNEWVYAQ